MKKVKCSSHTGSLVLYRIWKKHHKISSVDAFCVYMFMCLEAWDNLIKFQGMYLLSMYYYVLVVECVLKTEPKAFGVCQGGYEIPACVPIPVKKASPSWLRLPCTSPRATQRCIQEDSQTNGEQVNVNKGLSLNSWNALLYQESGTFCSNGNVLSQLLTTVFAELSIVGYLLNKIFIEHSKKTSICPWNQAKAYSRYFLMLFF